MRTSISENRPISLLPLMAPAHRVERKFSERFAWGKYGILRFQTNRPDFFNGVSGA